MPEEIKINRAAVQSAAQQVSSELKQKTGSKGPWAVLVLVVALVVVLGVLFKDKLAGNNMSKNPGASTSLGAGKYQAVFLANGQVYFGRISNTPEDWVTMSEIYYLQVVQPPLQGSGQPAQGSAQQPQISLIKLGQELHGPEDKMHINRDQILFWEDLKPDGQVTKAIEDYKKSQAQTPK